MEFSSLEQCITDFEVSALASCKSGMVIPMQKVLVSEKYHESSRDNVILTSQYQVILLAVILLDDINANNVHWVNLLASVPTSNSHYMVAAAVHSV